MGGSISLTRWDDTTYIDITFVRSFGVDMSLLQSGDHYIPFPLGFNVVICPSTPSSGFADADYSQPFETTGGDAKVISKPEINASIEYPQEPDGEIKIVVVQTHNVTISYDNECVISLELLSILSLKYSLKGIVPLAAQLLNNVKVNKNTKYIHITCTITFNG